MLCLVTGASQRVSAAGLEHICAERPVALKLRKFAYGFSDHVSRDLTLLRLGDGSAITTRKSRSGAAPSANAWRGADHRDFGDRIAILADDYENHPKETLQMYNPKSSKRMKFEPETVRAWVKIANSEVQRVAKLRATGEWF